MLWTTLTVTNTNDAGVGSLRAAIAAADQHPGRDTIDFAPSVTGTITLLSALPDLSTDIVIDGPGPAALSAARSRADGTPNFRIFTVASGAEVSITGVTISGGHEVFGGGILNSGSLTLTDCAVRGNSADGTGAGISNFGMLSLRQLYPRG